MTYVLLRNFFSFYELKFFSKLLKTNMCNICELNNWILNLTIFLPWSNIILDYYFNIF